ncbi:MAG: dihydropteroate synthase [Bacteroidota bacterium]|jgi:dihydropteroate synthase
MPLFEAAQYFSLNCRGKLLSAERPLVMGILNLTPDSFYAGSRFNGFEAVLAQSEMMLEAGASILDLGGQSTRPGAAPVSAEEELSRVLPALEALLKRFPDAVVSIDTFYASVARACVEAGASIVNDISAGEDDPNMLETVAKLQVPYIAMHKKGTPQNMQQLAVYDDVTNEVMSYFAEKIHLFRQHGIHEVVLDPGFGFAKTVAQNFELLSRLEDFRVLGHPLLVGVSRKSMIWRTLNCTPEEALNGSTALHTVALMKGASILRVHDVREAVETIRLLDCLP